MLKGRSVRARGMSPEMVFADGIVAQVYLEMDLPCVRTSINDGRHSYTSSHYAGNAVDYRTKNIGEPHKLPVVKQIAKHLGATVHPSKPHTFIGLDFDVIWEDVGGVNEHLHVQFKPKAT